MCQPKETRPRHGRNVQASAVDIALELESPDEHDDLFDTYTLSIDTTNKHMSCEVYAPLTHHIKGVSREAQGKVDTGARVSSMPLSMLPQLDSLRRT